MRIRTRIITATVLVAGLLTAATACGGTASVDTKPKGSTAEKAKDKGEGTSEEKGEAEAKDKDAGVGDTLALSGMEEGSELDVTVVKVADPAKSGDEFSSPQAGNRSVGVQFQLVNTGGKPYADSPQNGAQLADAKGQQFESTFADITAGPSMSSDVKLRPGAKALGWVVFEVPKGAKPVTAQFAMDSGFADESGQWNLK
ncbi:DUF4352 domain-containing protein [Streptomyces monticola]|uniref:DUF4352 domain-containing protein n=1 Tax=Streptomyces monticola TaxID=2666263 RepID=A0ABW2JPL4_9ACTN